MVPANVKRALLLALLSDNTLTGHLHPTQRAHWEWRAEDLGYLNGKSLLEIFNTVVSAGQKCTRCYTDNRRVAEGKRTATFYFSFAGRTKEVLPGSFPEECVVFPIQFVT